MEFSRRDFLKTSTGAAASLALGAPAWAAPALSPRPAASAKRPRNVLFLMCDQHRPDALGRYGDPYALTPALDALAASGTSLRQTYCQNPVCVPARNSILIGRYSHSMGVLNNGNATPRELLTFPQYLRSKGYVAGCFGKLHVSGRGDQDWDVVDQGSRDSKAPLPPGAVILQTRFSGRQPLGAPDPRPMTETREWQAKEGAIAFMKTNRGRPWVIQCSMQKPHPPFQPPKEYWDKIDRSKLEIPRYPADDLNDVHPRLWQSMVQRKLDNLSDDQVRDAMQGYYGNLAFADAMLGEVLKALDDLGLREGTLIIFTADHGEMLYHHRLWTKFAFFDPSVRVPLIVSCPGVAPPGRETKALVEHVDLFPTIMDLLGFDTPPSVQGRSFIPALTGKSDAHRDFVRSEHYFGEDGKLQAALMQFDGRYKYIDNGPNAAPEFYDQQTDPREITSIHDAPEHREKVQAVVAELRRWVAQDVFEPLKRGGKNKNAKSKKSGEEKAASDELPDED